MMFHHKSPEIVPDASEMNDEGLSDDLFAALDEAEDDGEQSPPSLPVAPSAAGALLPSVEKRAPFMLPLAPHLDLVLRPYQQEATDAWLREGGRGTVVLPTGAGKTIVACDAIARLGVRTLVIVPTIELLHQWKDGVAANLHLPDQMVGAIGGGQHIIGPLTVITYDSAAMKRRQLSGYGLLVFDEVHHLPAESYRVIVEKAAAPWCLGLSATLERADGRHKELAELIGPIVYQRSAEELSAQKHIAAYKERRILVDLAPQEELRYETLMAEWRWYLATRRSQLGTGSSLFNAIIYRSSFDADARRALRAHHEARLVALNAEAKLAAIEELLRKHAKDKVIVFSEYVSMVDRISQQLMLPAITYRTPAIERRAILEGFRSGTITKIAAGRVLNEGVDVPDANVAIVASGSSSMREYVQRLGRILRPKATEAQLYEIISRRTTERNAARRRHPPRKMSGDARG